MLSKCERNRRIKNLKFTVTDRYVSAEDSNGTYVYRKRIDSVETEMERLKQCFDEIYQGKR